MRSRNVKSLPSSTVARGIRRAELPPLQDADLWAHVQIEGNPDVAVAVGTPAARARLLSPRRLEPNRHYVACVVPTFRATVLATLGADEASIIHAALSPAWSPDGPAEVELPCFFSWTFATGAEGDFESLARALRPVVYSDADGLRAMDLTAPGLELPSAPAAPQFGGVLRPPQHPAARARLDQPFPAFAAVEGAPADRQFVDELATAVSSAGSAVLAEAAYEKALASDADWIPRVGPTLYGATPANARAVSWPPAKGSPPWLAELNLDPRSRVAAAVGHDTATRHQEQFVSEAWRQFPQLREANRLLDAVVISRELGASLERRVFRRLAEPRLVLMTQALHGRVLQTGGRTVLAALLRSQVPPGFVSAQLVALTRSATSLDKRSSGADTVGLAIRRAVVESTLIPPARVLDGVHSLAPTSEVLGTAAAAGVYRRLVPTGGGQVKVVMQAHLMDRVATLFRSRSWTPESLDRATRILGKPDILAAFLASRGLTTVEAMRAEPLDDQRVENPRGMALIRQLAADRAQHHDDPRPASAELLDAYVTVVRERGLCSPDEFRAIVRGIAPEEPPAAAALAVEPVAGDLAPALRAVFETVAAKHYSESVAPRTSVLEGLTAESDLFAPFVIASLDADARARRRIEAQLVRQNAQPFDRVRVAPRFRDPALELMARSRPDWVVPGLAALPQDSVAVAEVDVRFVAAFMVGMNDAIARELLWRDYPIDLRATLLRTFWPGGAHPDDLVPLDGAGQLDLAALVAAADVPSAFILRARLFERFPDTAIGLAKTVVLEKRRTIDPATLRIPDITCRIGSDVRIAGFAGLRIEDLLDADGDPDAEWWFVFSERSEGARFGLDTTSPGGAPASWDDAAWPLGEEKFLTRDSFRGAARPRRAGGAVKHPWGADSASQALALMQSPVRVALRAAGMLGAIDGGGPH